jgi:electron transport complex protein RnfB
LACITAYVENPDLSFGIYIGMDTVIWWSLIVLAGMGLVLGLVLAIFSKIFVVTVDRRIAKVERVLPGINCGVCGFAGCHAMAEALVEGRAQPNQCKPGGRSVVQRVSSILGIVSEEAEELVAVVRCQGGRREAKEKADYRGVAECTAAEIVGGGAKACVYGCLGYGTCAHACPFEAIVMTGDRLPKIIEERCTGCGTCVKACPRNIIALVPRKQKVYVGCVSNKKGKEVKEVCTVGCIACGLCARPEITPSGKVVLKDNLPDFPPDWNDFRTAVEKCPAQCFVVRKA